MVHALRVMCVSLAVVATMSSVRAADPFAQDNLGQVSGVVLDGNRRPVADARVNLRPVYSTVSDGISVPTAPNTPTRDVFTASNGTFLLTSVLPGRYFLVARKAGMVGGYFGQESASDEMQWFNLHPSEKTSGVVLRLWQGAAVGGTVRSASGTPIANTWVQVIEIRRENGVPRLYSLQSPVQTDGRGAYWFAGLSSGRYLVRTSAKSFGMPMLDEFRSMPSATYYPGTPFADSSNVIAIEVPAERPDVDITIPESAQGFDISGRIQGLPAAVFDRTVKLVLDDPGTVFPPYFETASAPIQEDGTFAFRGVPPGRYRIRALAIPTSADQRLRQGRYRPGTEGVGKPVDDERAVWVSQEVVVRDQSLTDLRLQASPGLRVTGKVALTGEVLMDPTRLIIQARSLDGWNLEDVLVGGVDRDGNFASPAVPPGRYIVTVGSRELFVESTVVQQQDVTDVGVVVANVDLSGVAMTLTTLRGQITGRVIDNTGKARADASIVCVRQDSQWLSAPSSAGLGIGAYRVRTNPAGDYTLSLGAGSYALMAIVGDVPADFGDKDFLRSVMPKAVSISLPRGRKVIQNLEVQVYRK